MLQDLIVVRSQRNVQDMCTGCHQCYSESFNQIRWILMDFHWNTIFDYWISISRPLCPSNRNPIVVNGVVRLYWRSIGHSIDFVFCFRNSCFLTVSAGVFSSII